MWNKIYYDFVIVETVFIWIKLKIVDSKQVKVATIDFFFNSANDFSVPITKQRSFLLVSCCGDFTSIKELLIYSKWIIKFFFYWELYLLHFVLQDSVILNLIMSWILSSFCHVPKEFLSSSNSISIRIFIRKITPDVKIKNSIRNNSNKQFKIVATLFRKIKL